MQVTDGMNMDQLDIPDLDVALGSITPQLFAPIMSPLGGTGVMMEKL